MGALDQQFHLTVERLAATAEEQGLYLQRLGTTPSADELALEFSDALSAARGDLDDAVVEAALRLDGYLSEISGQANAELWTIAALGEAPQWARIRQLARDLLRCMAKKGR